MSLTRTTRRAGLTLILLGTLGAAFFWMTDPRYGPMLGRGAGWYDPRAWFEALRGTPANLIDAANQSAPATLVGVAGCLAVLAIGLWLVTRRRV